MLHFLLLAGMLLLATGSFLNASRAQLSNPIILSGLVVEFLGTIWLVLSLNQRRKKQKF
jgi:DMSO reductase anchor subunit